MTIQEELKSIFAKFNLTVAQIQARLSEIGMVEYSQFLSHPPKRAWAQHAYFAMASFILNNANLVLEVGTGRGDSANTLSRLFPDSTVYTIDVGPNDPLWKRTWRGKYPKRVAVYDRNLDRENIKVIENNSFFLPMLGLPEKFSLIYVDGDHSYPAVAADISFAYSRLQTGGFLFMHDYEAQPVEHDVNHAVNWMRKRIKEEVSEFPMFISEHNVQANLKIACLVKE